MISCGNCAKQYLIRLAFIGALRSSIQDTCDIFSWQVVVTFQHYSYFFCWGTAAGCSNPYPTAPQGQNFLYVDCPAGKMVNKRLCVVVTVVHQQLQLTWPRLVERARHFARLCPKTPNASTQQQPQSSGCGSAFSSALSRSHQRGGMFR